jgi:Pyridoxamine 5'-phosphate oxidase
VTWGDDVDEVLHGDLTAALGYRTPAGGAVALAVAPVGLHDRSAGRVGFTTSLGFSKKLDRIAEDPRVALAFHAREHGTSQSQAYVLVQGRATVIADPSPARKQELIEKATRYLGAVPRNRFWDWWLREYGDVRVPVDVVVVWPDLRCAGEPVVHGAPLPEPPRPQKPPKNGTGPRVDMERAAKRLAKTKHHLATYCGGDGYPVVLPVSIGEAGPDGFRLASAAPLPDGGRRAGLLGHSYRPKLVGLLTRTHTGWLDGGLYAPHTEVGYQAPPNKTLLLLVNGGFAKVGVRKARRTGKL